MRVFCSTGLIIRAAFTHTEPEEKPGQPFSVINDAQSIFF